MNISAADKKEQALHETMIALDKAKAKYNKALAVYAEDKTGAAFELIKAEAELDMKKAVVAYYNNVDELVNVVTRDGFDITSNKYCKAKAAADSEYHKALAKIRYAFHV